MIIGHNWKFITIYEKPRQNDAKQGKTRQDKVAPRLEGVPRIFVWETIWQENNMSSTRSLSRAYYEAQSTGCVFPKTRFMGPTWGPSGAGGTQVGPMLAPWTLLSVLCLQRGACPYITMGSWVIIPHTPTKFRGYTGFSLSVRLSVRPSLDQIVLALCFLNTSRIYSIFTPTSGGVSRGKLLFKLQNFNLWGIRFT